MQDSIKGYRNSIFATDFSNPFVVIDALICYFIETQNIDSPKDFSSIKIMHSTKPPIYLEFSRKVEFLRMYNITNTDIIRFVDNFLLNKTINNVSLYVNELYYKK